MKRVIKTTIFASLMVAIAINLHSISKEYIKAYGDCVAYLASNASMPNGF